eukprot:12809023-Alexandrium_andersonii.AAC.1
MRLRVQRSEMVMLSTSKARRTCLRLRGRDHGSSAFAVSCAIRDLGATLDLSRGGGIGLGRK